MFPSSISPGALIIAYGVFQLILIFAIGGVSMSLVYRYGTVFPGLISKLIASKTSMYFYIFWQLVAVSLMFIIGHSLPFDDKSDMISRAIAEYPALFAFTNTPTFAYFDKNIIRIGVIISLFTMLVLPVFFGAFSAMLIYKIKHTNVQTISYKSQVTLIHSVIAQIIVTVLFLFLPILPASIFILFEIPYGGPIMVYCLCIISLHSLMEIIVTLIFVLPYRKFIASKATAFWRQIVSRFQNSPARAGSAKTPKQIPCTNRRASYWRTEDHKF